MGAVHPRTPSSISLSVLVGALIRREEDEIQFLSVEEDAGQKRLYRDLHDKDFSQKTILFYSIYLSILLSIIGFCGGGGGVEETKARNIF